MTSHVEASLWVVRVVGNASCILDVTNTAEKTDAASKVLGLSIKIESILNKLLSFKILGPPLVEGRVFEALDEGLKAVDHVHLSEHTRNFSLVGSTLDVVLDGTINFMDSFEVLCHLEVCILEVDTVIFLSDFDSLVPLTAGHVKFDEEVVPSTLFIEFFSIVNHVELNSNHGKSSFNFLLTFSLTCGFCTTSKTHVSKAHHCDVQSFSLDTHLCHVLPYCVVMDISNTIVGLVHVAYS